MRGWWVAVFIVVLGSGVARAGETPPQVTEALYDAVLTHVALDANPDAVLPELRATVERLEAKLDARARPRRVNKLRDARLEVVQRLEAADPTYRSQIEPYRESLLSLSETPEGRRVLTAFNDDREPEALALLADSGAPDRLALQVELAIEAHRRGRLADGALVTLVRERLHRWPPAREPRLAPARARARLRLQRLVLQLENTAESRRDVLLTLVDLALASLRQGVPFDAWSELRYRLAQAAWPPDGPRLEGVTLFELGHLEAFLAVYDQAAQHYAQALRGVPPGAVEPDERLDLLRADAGFVASPDDATVALAATFEENGDLALARGDDASARALYADSLQASHGISKVQQLAGGRAIVTMKRVLAGIVRESSHEAAAFAALRSARHDALALAKRAGEANLPRHVRPLRPRTVGEEPGVSIVPTDLPASCAEALASLPPIPEPIPRPSTATTLSPSQLRRLLASMGRSPFGASLFDTMGALAEITANRGYLERSYYRLREQCGLAMVTRVEQIGVDGTPVPPPNRFLDPRYPERRVSRDFDDVITALSDLFFVRRGFSRLLVFVVAERSPDIAARRDMTPVLGMETLESGASLPPEATRDVPLHPDLFMNVLVYEFEIRETDAEPTASQVTRLDAMAHLEGAQLSPIARAATSTPP